MLRRLIVVTALAAGVSIAAGITLATPALAKGPSQARVTGPGLVHAVVVSGDGEPGQQGMLAALAGQTGLFTVLFGPTAGIPGPTPVPEETLLEKWARDSKIMDIFEGTQQIQQLVVARRLLGLSSSELK